MDIGLQDKIIVKRDKSGPSGKGPGLSSKARGNWFRQLL